MTACADCGAPIVWLPYLKQWGQRAEEGGFWMTCRLYLDSHGMLAVDYHHSPGTQQRRFRVKPERGSDADTDR